VYPVCSGAVFPPGHELGRYEIRSLLGKGGMGVVYRAYDPLLRRDVALKTLRADWLVDKEGQPRAAAEARFLREARAAASLRHPSVVAVHDVGYSDGVPFIAMELVEGRVLRSVMDEPGAALSTRVGWLVEVASALAAAHAHGIVHRDVKPENVMIDDRGNARVLDFGIARRVRIDSDAPSTLTTADGRVVGTQRYMAPEQLAGAAVDERADQYAWGVLAYELIAGTHPADAAGMPPGCPAAMVSMPPLLHTLVSGLPFELAAVVSTAMASNPAKRYAAMEDAARALETAAQLSGDSLDRTPPLAEVAGPAELLGGRYELLGELGRGGSGIVYRARDTKAQELVAIKLVKSDTGTSERLDRFRRELQLARKVTHPNVVRIYDLVELRGRFGLSMELVDGEPLDARLSRGPLAPLELVALATDLARALAAAHAAGVVHRDLKPANVLIRTRDGSAVVTDFGVSRALEEDDAPVSSMSDAQRLKLTASNAIVGTPLYMAPEQLDGSSEVGPAADVFAFGLVVFEAATGRKVHETGMLGELRRLRRESPAPPLANVRRGLSRRLCDAVDRALALDPRDRFHSGVELLESLDPLTTRAPWTGPRAAVVGIGAIGVAALAIGVTRGRQHVAEQAPSPSGSPKAPFSLRLSEEHRRLTHGECEEHPVFTRDGRALLYDGTVGPDSYIFRLDVAGGDPVQLTRVRGWDTAPELSPDGTQFAFYRIEEAARGIYVAALDGHASPRSVAPEAISASWSSDGRGLWVSIPPGLVEYDVATSAPMRTLEAPAGMRGGFGKETPNGSVVAWFYSAKEDASVLGTFTSDGAFHTLLQRTIQMAVLTPDGRDAIVEVAKVGNGGELLDVPLDGTPPTQIPSGGVLSPGSMAFSPDGKQTVWSTCTGTWAASGVDSAGRFSPLFDAEGETLGLAPIPRADDLAVVSTRSGKAEPWVVDPTGHRPPRVIPVGELRPTHIAVSHGGSLFAIACEHAGIYLGALEGDPRLHELTSDPLDSMPTFRLGDEQALFTRRGADGQTQVMAVPVAGGDVTPLLPPGSDAASSSPREDRIVYLSGAAGKQVPMIWDARSGASRPLSAALTSATYYTPRFSPDGRRVVVVRLSELLEVEVGTGAVLRTVGANKAQGLFDPAYSRSGFAVLRKSWTGNLWTADILP
jgi:serine/threonine protein kinase